MKENEYHIIPVKDGETDEEAIARWKEGNRESIKKADSLRTLKKEGWKVYGNGLVWPGEDQEGIKEVVYHDDVLFHPDALQRYYNANKADVDMMVSLEEKVASAAVSEPVEEEPERVGGRIYRDDETGDIYIADENGELQKLDRPKQ